MKDYRKLLAVGGVILVLPFIRPFLAFASKNSFLISSIGFVTMMLGLVLMITEKS